MFFATYYLNMQIYKKRKPHRKQDRLRIVIQCVIAAFVIHLIVILSIFYYSGHAKYLKGMLSIKTWPSKNKKAKLLAPKLSSLHNSKGQESLSQKRSIQSQEEIENVFCWTDKRGIKNFSNIRPPDDVTDFEVRRMYKSEKGKETKVVIRANGIFVPVKLGYGGKELSTYLLLDTGASTTILHQIIARQLNIRSFRPAEARVADGRIVQAMSTNLDYIIVGPHKLSNFKTLVVDHEGNPTPYKGLLGMNFLREVNYHLDFQNEVISWAQLK